MFCSQQNVGLWIKFLAGWRQHDSILSHPQVIIATSSILLDLLLNCYHMGGEAIVTYHCYHYLRQNDEYIARAINISYPLKRFCVIDWH
jgi:hypothetical protein